jgi:hypothetical protein
MLKRENIKPIKPSHYKTHGKNPVGKTRWEKPTNPGSYTFSDLRAEVENEKGRT